jgi:hypothetical protein
MFAEGTNEAFAANFGNAQFYFGTLGGSDEAGFEITEATRFVLTYEFADVFTWRSPVSGGDLSLYVFFERFGERDV